MNKIRNDPVGIKWYTITQNVDVETGEIISNSLKERKYIAIRKSKTTEIKEYRNGEKFGIIKYTIECEKNRQRKLW